jgi:hypothetical protein
MSFNPCMDIYITISHGDRHQRSWVASTPAICVPKCDQSIPSSNQIGGNKGPGQEEKSQIKLVICTKLLKDVQRGEGIHWSRHHRKYWGGTWANNFTKRRNDLDYLKIKSWETRSSPARPIVIWQPPFPYWRSHLQSRLDIGWWLHFHSKVCLVIFSIGSKVCWRDAHAGRF